ncbi:MAG: sulfatase, partial [Anaerolineales bacterium]
HRGFDTFKEIWRSPGERALRTRIRSKLRSARERITSGTSKPEPDYGATATNRQVKEWVNHSRDTQRPFFLFINYSEIHSPYRPPSQHRNPLLRDVVSSPDFEIPAHIQRVSEQPLDYITGRITLEPQDIEILRALYDGGVRDLDAKIGELLDILDKSKVLDDTLVIITADHGDNLGEHGLLGHMLCLYDTLLHVPLIMTFPRQHHAGMRISAQVQLVDLLPTILDLIEITDDRTWRSIQGRSLLGCLQGAEHRHFAVAEYGRPNILEVLRHKYPDFECSGFDRELKAIRSNGYKYIWSSDGRSELFNIADDPSESENLIAANPAKATELRSQLMDWLDQHSPNSWPPSPVSVDIDPVTVERLRALGYID